MLPISDDSILNHYIPAASLQASFLRQPLDSMHRRSCTASTENLSHQQHVPIHTRWVAKSMAMTVLISSHLAVFTRMPEAVRF